MLRPVLAATAAAGRISVVAPALAMPPAEVRQVKANEPVIELEDACLLGEQILRDTIDLGDGVHSRAMIGDHAPIHQIQRAEVTDRIGSPEVAVVPGPIVDVSPLKAARDTPECCDPFGNVVDHLDDS